MWWNKRFNKWINICIENPLKTWKQAKEYFIKPKCKIHFFKNPMYNCPHMDLKRIARIIDIMASDIMWKEKYCTARHERSPYVWVCFFRRFGFSVNWHIYYKDEFNQIQNGDSYYWEYLLDYLYFDRILSNVPTWISTSLLYNKIEYGNTQKEDVKIPIDSVIPVAAMSLNKRGMEKLKNEL